MNGVNDHGDGNPTILHTEDARNNHDRSYPVEGTIVVVAKCPIPGKSKTRLIPLLGKEGSVRLAKSMLSDVLKTIDGCSELENVRKILLYAPGTPEGLETMEVILEELNLGTKGEDNPNSWHLLPMISSSSQTKDDLRSHDLGAKLEDALTRARTLEEPTKRGGVVFLGMDAPILPLDDIVGSFKRAAGATPSATLCPAFDGGYAMLCVPPDACPSETFRNLYWSHPWTGMSQTKALTDQGIFVTIGTVVSDIDETSDVQELCRYLGIPTPQQQSSPQQQQQQQTTPTPVNGTKNNNSKTAKKNLEFPCRWCEETAVGKSTTIVTSTHPTCHFSRMVLEDALGDRSGL